MTFASAICLLLLSYPLLAQPQPLLIKGGQVFDTNSGTFRSNRGLAMRAGKFMQVDVDLSGPAAQGYQVVQLQDDDFILPGIFDMHAHYNVDLVGRGRRDETVANPSIFLANGVTSTFPGGEFNPEDMFELSERIDRGLQPGPRIFNSGPYFGTARRGWNREASEEDIHKEVDHWAKRGAAGFKAKGINARHLKALIERAHMHGLSVTGHLGSGFRGSVNPRDAILMGIDRIEHFLGGDQMPAERSAYASLVDVAPGQPGFKEIVQLFISHGVFFDATVSAYGYYGEREVGYDYWTDETRFYTSYVREFLKKNPGRRAIGPFGKIHQVKQKTLKAFYDAGGLITLGTDHPSTGEFIAGFSAHRELDVFVRAGIKPVDALRMATINGARALGVSDRLGSIEAGKLADLFVIKGDPLQDIRRTRSVHLVVKGGRLYRSQELLKSVEGKMGPSSDEEADAWYPNRFQRRRR